MLIPNSRMIGRAGLILKKYSPEILTGVGLASMTAGAFLAIRATTKLEKELLMAETRVVEIREAHELSIDNPEVEPYSHREYERALRRAYLRNVMEFTKLYGPAVTLFVSGVGSILAGHGIMRKRNVALVAAYNAVEKSFAAYRARVIQDLGDEKDRDYRYGITETTEKGEDGKRVTSAVVDPGSMSRYARIFDETNPEWQREPGFNQFFLTSTQNWFNDKLLAVGHVFLNEVYERLGFEHTKEGAVVGWVIGSNGGDQFIDFGIYDAANQAKRDFVNGYEQSIWLDFNVDGLIYDKI